ncbi:exodeoxyribonuclease VII large subunit [Candidatus Sumerlaeota bacterium]|nr:exodeoxyribonuclease VII large subunit [Candidatus Sumerlaeota bacterium]
MTRKHKNHNGPFGDKGDDEALDRADAPLPSAKGKRPVFTVGELTRQIRLLLEIEIGEVAVEGEISNWRVAASGHAYFLLKDAEASIRCVMFRPAVARLGFQVADGKKVEVKGRVSVYEARGEYQIVVESMVEHGLGALFEAFVKLKEQLEKEGLFDPAHKKPLPFLPRRIGVITSPTGAAVRDILKVLRRRFANVHILLWPVRVQGEGAAAEIAHALRAMDRRQLADVIICGRGGGSIEDLWAFNEEVVARAIYDCQTPVISAVGHEIDFTIADFVADVRAPTPSAAAEMVILSQVELSEKLKGLASRLTQTVFSRLHYLRRHLEGLLRSYALEQPRFRVEQLRQQTDDLLARLSTHVSHTMTLLQRQLDTLMERLGAGARGWARTTAVGLLEMRRRLQRATGEQIARVRQRLESLLERFEVLGPQATLKRGYSIVLLRRTAEIVSSPRQAGPNDPLHIHTAGGLLPALAKPQDDYEQGDLFESLSEQARSQRREAG